MTLLKPILSAGLLSLLSACGGPPAPPDPFAANGTIGPAGTELVGDFSDLCLKRFPIEAFMNEAIARKHFTPMNRDELQAVSPGDGGRGWWITSKADTYAMMVTPTSCTLRKVYERVPNFSSFFQAAVGDWVGSQHLGSLRQFPSLGDGAAVTHQMGTVDNAGNMAQVFQGAVRPAGNGTTEIRLVHKLPAG